MTDTCPSCCRRRIPPTTARHTPTEHIHTYRCPTCHHTWTTHRHRTAYTTTRKDTAR